MKILLYYLYFLPTVLFLPAWCFKSLSFIISFIKRTSISCYFKVGELATHSFKFLLFENILISSDSWRMFSLDEDSRNTVVLFQYLKAVVLLPFVFRGFWWEIHCHLNYFAIIGKVSFFSGCFQDSFFVFHFQSLTVICCLNQLGLPWQNTTD